MSLNKIKISIVKILLPVLYNFFKILRANNRVINFLKDKLSKANDYYNFEKSIKNLLENKKLIALDVGSQGGFNSDTFFSKKYNKFFFPILVDPLNEKDRKNSNQYIDKGLWSSKEKKKLHILGKRPGSSSMYEPDLKSLEVYGIKKKDFHLFDVTKTIMVECETIDSSLKSLNMNSLDYLKIDTQGAELEILKGLGKYYPLMIKCEVQVYPMYKNIPSWTELLNHLNKLNYMLCDWKVIGSHVTRSPVEMDMVFIPDFSKPNGQKIILDRQKEFVSLMLICGQLRLLNKISESLSLKYSEYQKNINDKFFD